MTYTLTIEMSDEDGQRFLDAIPDPESFVERSIIDTISAYEKGQQQAEAMRDIEDKHQAPKTKIKIEQKEDPHIDHTLPEHPPDEPPLGEAPPEEPPVEEPPPGEPMVATFTYDPPAPTRSDTITFDASPSTGSIDTYAWDLGGEAAAEGVTAAYSFGKKGTFDVVLTITGPDGQVTGSQQVTTT